jgi:hypothetical protein
MHNCKQEQKRDHRLLNGVIIWKDPGYGDLKAPQCYVKSMFPILLKLMWILVSVETTQTLLECAAICFAVVPFHESDTECEYLLS